MYDFVIIGGGISGLYTAHSILCRFPNKQIVILEKETRLGGRIYTFKNKYVSNIEAGAGRFHKKHKLLIELIKLLNLENQIISISKNAHYINCKNQQLYSHSILDNIIYKLNFKSKLFTKKQLINILFRDFLFITLSEKDANYFIHSFGFSTEFNTMNSYDAIILIKVLFNDQFFVLKGGLSQIIENLVLKLKKMKCLIINNSTVKNIDHDELTSIFKITYNSTHIFTKQCICAIPVCNLTKLPIFHSIAPMLNNSIYCGSLCRIYSVFPLDTNGKVWFHGLTKFTTQNDLRMVIPINENTGVIMISYTDGEYANHWKDIHDKNGMRHVENKIKNLIFKCLNIHIPTPIYTKMFYWNCGVGYWKTNTNSYLISQQICHPFLNKTLFICGENYSNKHQQWIEGALETSNHITNLIFQKKI
jgi:monoamine oxidase